MFERPAGLRNCLTKMDPDKVHVASSPDHPILTGVRKWVKEYNDRLLPKHEVLQSVQGWQL